MNVENIVANLVALNGGELVGHMRLHKQTYLLDCCGADLGLQYTYHQRGPYSCELAAGPDYARAEGWIDIEERLGRYKISYAIFKTRNLAEAPENLGKLSAEDARDLLEKMRDVSDTVLEIAATIAFMHNVWDYVGKPEGRSAVEETKARKSYEGIDEGISQALDLLRDLGLNTEAFWRGAPAS